MEPIKWIFFSIFLTAYPQYAQGCVIEGIDTWLVAESQTILDTFKGTIWDRATSSIEAINSISYREGLNAGPYVTISFVDSRLIIATNEAYSNYEEYETALSFGFTINFRCTGGTSRPLVFVVDITDTNNHDPLFRPSSAYEFTVAPPLPPGFLITNCAHDVIVRDVDLTTERIDFEISNSSLFEIAYDDSSTVPKEFKASLRTTTFIRRIPEPIVLTVTATDVDKTGDPRRTSTATIQVTANTEFEFPDEPVFAQPFYRAAYTRDNEFVLTEYISLRQGFDDQVKFTSEGLHAEYFELYQNGNQISFNMKSPLPTTLFPERQLILVVTADREYTSGATATVILQLPEEINLSFEKAVYEGSIVDNSLRLEYLILSEGYEETPINIYITGEHSSYFTVSVESNTISMHMNPLSESVLRKTNFITLQVSATSASNGTGTTVVALEVIKDDVTTPVFDKHLYTGTYYMETGLQLEPIEIVQGYDDTVEITLEGEHASLFRRTQAGPKISLSLPNLPSELAGERNLLVTVLATKPRTVGANAVVKITLPTARELRFERPVYKGTLEDDVITLETIMLNVGYDVDVNFTLSGEYAQYFSVNATTNEVALVTSRQISEELLQNNVLVLVLSASGTTAATTTTSIVLEVVKEDTTTPVFSQNTYHGKYWNSTVMELEEISLSQGFDDTVKFRLDGGHAQYFSINSTENDVILILNSPIPGDVIFEEKVLLFDIIAEKPRTVGATAVIALRFPQELIESTPLKFTKNYYKGLLDGDNLNIEEIALLSDFTSDTIFSLRSDFSQHFALTNSNNVVKISLSDTASLEDLKKNRIIVIEIEANRERAIPATCVLVIKVPETIVPVFDRSYYTGTLVNETLLEFTEVMGLRFGFDDTVTFDLEGDNSQWFALVENGNSVTLITNASNPIPDEVFVENNHLLFEIVAHKPGTDGGRSAIHITVTQEFNPITPVAFSKDFYKGYYGDGQIDLEEITLDQEYIGELNLTLNGDNANYFQVYRSNGTIRIMLNNEIPTEVIGANNILVFTLEANTVTNRAHATIILEVRKDRRYEASLNFEHAYYVGSYSEITGFVFEPEIRLVNGSEDTVTFELSGDQSSWFSINQNGNSANLTQSTQIPDYIAANYRNLIFTIAVENNANSTARAVILIEMLSGSDVTGVSFDQVLYRGNLEGNTILSHETITVSGFNGSTITVFGEHQASFQAFVLNGVVTVEVVSPTYIATNLTYTALTLQAASAKAVLIIDITPSVDPDRPTISFSSSSYFLWASQNQTGVLGRVQATVSTGEAVLYTFTTENDDLRRSISINSEGEIRLSVAVDEGEYSIKVMATAQNSQISATVPVLLRVVNTPVCETEAGLPPLIILERLEEEPHRNLVVLNHTEHRNCSYSVTSLWPVDQPWLYVDSDGLHARTVDREHGSIAFMTVSQVQVELTIHCDDPPAVRRSLTADNPELDSDSYGSNKWIIADTIAYDARRSVVNLIVQDINDNSPIFVGKDNEPLYVGYPEPELEVTVSPRSLIQLKATDADIGENAALVYWSDEDTLAVSPTTGSVHVRSGARLADGARLTVHATDRLGMGRNGSLDFVVKLLARNQIAVVTVKNSFLDDETTILQDLSSSVGYEIKGLRTVVVSEDIEDISRKRRDTRNAAGASLQLHVYGMMGGTEPVDVATLTSDIDRVSSAGVVRVLSLDDHLEGVLISPAPGRDHGFFIATIVLAVLLLMFIVTILVFYYLTWRKAQNYEKFSDVNSLASRVENEPLPKVEMLQKPRLDIGELKRSERRLQEMLDAPVPTITVEPALEITNKIEEKELPQEPIVNISPDPQMPIVIQSIDKLKDSNDEIEDDEFGEVTTVPRKSVVTFNENVEKIIHIEDGIDDEVELDFEVYKF